MTVTRSRLAEMLTVERLADDPYPVVAQLRREQPVAWAPAMDRWLVSSRDLVVTVAEDVGRFTTDSPKSLIGSTFGRQMLSTDGDEQRRHRAPYTAAFRPRALRDDAAPTVAARAHELIGMLLSGDDLTGPASRIAVATVLDMLGLRDIATAEAVSRWYDDLAAALANVVGDPEVAARGKGTAAEIGAAMADAGLLRDEGPLTAQEQVSNTLLVLFGGIETTQSAILNAVYALALHPDAQTRVRHDRGLMGSAIEESLRWEPSVLTLTRFATSDVLLAGTVIPADSTVECLIAGANRDPAAFPDPDRFDLDRPNAADHLTFGAGRHFCLGAHLARLEATAFLGALLDRTPDGFGFAEADPPAPRGHEFRHPPRLRLDW